MVPQHRVRARRVHDVDVLQPVLGQVRQSHRVVLAAKLCNTSDRRQWRMIGYRQA
jgi:hypothetical protein